MCVGQSLQKKSLSSLYLGIHLIIGESHAHSNQLQVNQIDDRRCVYTHIGQNTVITHRTHAVKKVHGYWRIFR